MKAERMWHGGRETTAHSGVWCSPRTFRAVDVLEEPPRTWAASYVGIAGRALDAVPFDPAAAARDSTGDTAQR